MGPKILLWDAETAPIIAHVWGLWENDVGLNQIERDWSLLSWAAKWLGEKAVFYEDQSKAKDIEDDKKILKGIWDLLDEADVVVTHNGKKFDKRKINARFILNGMKPPSSYREIDTLLIAKKHFAFTSNKLAYLTDKLCSSSKSTHHKFPGHHLWMQCLKGNQQAWKEMKKYNIQDVVLLEELLDALLPWDNTINFNTYTDSPSNLCHCGAKPHKNGFYYTETSRFQRYRCGSCGTETRGGVNLLPKEKRKSLLRRTTR